MSAAVESVIHFSCSAFRRFAKLAFAPALFLVAFGASLAAQSFSFVGINLNLGPGSWSQPYGVAEDSNHNVYVSQYTAGGVSIVDAATLQASPYLTDACGITLANDRGLLIDKNDNLYIADEASHSVIVWSIPTGACVATYTVATPYGMALDATGNLFIAANGGTNGVYRVMAGAASGSSASLLVTGSSPDSVAIAPATNASVSAGDLLVSDGAKVYRFTAASGYNATSKTTLISGLTGGRGLAFDASNNLIVADGPAGKVLRYAAPAYASCVVIGSDLANPTGVSFSNAGHLLLTDYNNSVVQEFTRSLPGQDIGTTSQSYLARVIIPAGTQLGSINILDAGALNAEFAATAADLNPNLCHVGSYPAASSCDIDLTFAPALPGLHRGALQILNNHGNVVDTAQFSGMGLAPILAFNPAVQATAGDTSILPLGLTADSVGNLYVADAPTQTVLEIPYSGGAYGAAVALTSTYMDPAGVAVDGAGNVFIADLINGEIDELPWNGTGFDPQITVVSGLSIPMRVVVDVEGSVYYADAGADAVYKLPWRGNSFGSPMTIGSGFTSPMSVAVDGSLNVYVADFENDRIEKIQWNGGAYNTQADVTTDVFAPLDVVIDTTNNDLYVADAGNTRIVHLPFDGVGYSYQETVADGGSAGLTNPTALAVDWAGNLYIADDGHQGILKLDASSTQSVQFSTPTSVGSQDAADGSLGFTISNMGNEPLDFPTPASGSNPDLAANFSYSSWSSCPSVSSSSAPFDLWPGESCSYAVDFIPASAGTISGSLVLSDNHLSAPGTQQVIPLLGTGETPIKLLSFLAPPAASVTAGGNAGAGIQVALLDSTNTPVDAAADTVSLTVTGPSAYSQSYNATPVHGVVTFDLSSAALTTAGSNAYTYMASIPLNPAAALATATESVVPGPASKIAPNGGVNQSAVIGAAFGATLQVLVTDNYTNPVSGAPVTFTVPGAGASAVFSGSTVVTTDNQGLASAPVAANTQAGKYSVHASISGGTTDATFPLNNTKGAPTIHVSAAPSSGITYGQAATTVTATVSFSAGSASGAVSFKDGATVLGSGSVNAGKASISAPVYLSAGTHTLGASYQGDSNYDAQDSATSSYQVNKAGVALSVPGSLNVDALSSTATLPVSIAGAYSGAGITVPSTGSSSTISCSFFKGAAAVGSPTSGAVAAGSSSATATCPIPQQVTAEGGSYSATVSFSGDANYAASDSSTAGALGNSLSVPFSVAAIKPSLTWTPDPTKTTTSYGATLAGVMSANASVNNNTVSGSVAYTATQGSAVQNVAPSTILSAGVYQLTATFTPTDTATYQTTSTSISYTVTKATPALAITVTPASPAVYGQAKTSVSGAITATAGAPTGSVLFHDGANNLGTSTVASGSASLATGAYMAAGSHSIVASYQGDNNFNTVDSSTISYTVNKAPVTLMAGTVAGIPALSTSSTITVAITGANMGAGILVPGSGGGATATCAFVDSTSTAIASSSGVVVAQAALASADCPVPAAVTAKAGSYSLHVSFNGDADYLGSLADLSGGSGNSLAVAFSVGALSPTVTWNAGSGGSTTASYGSALGALLNASASFNNTTIPGSFSYSTTIGGQTAAVTSTSLLSPGSYKITALFTPTDATAYSSASASINYTVQPATPSLVMAASSSAVFTGSPVSFTVALTGVQGAAIPTGSITFLDGSTPLGTATLDASGSATLKVTLTTTGTHSVTASFTGDINYATGTSNALSAVIADFALAAPAGGNTATVSAGQTANFTLNLGATGATTFPADITLSAANLPSGATVTITPSTVKAGSGATQVTVAITTAKTSAAAQPQNGIGRAVPLTLAILGLPLLGLIRARRRVRGYLMMLILAVAALGATGLTGCGSGFWKSPTSTTTTPQTYNVSVTGTSGSLTHSTQITLTVQ
jgi:sugar lactone lactonase YvrE